MKKLTASITALLTVLALTVNIFAAVPAAPLIGDTAGAVPYADTIAMATSYVGMHFSLESEVIAKLNNMGYEAKTVNYMSPLEPDIAPMDSITDCIEVKKNGVLCARIYYWAWKTDNPPTGRDYEMAYCAVYNTDLFSTGFDFSTADTDEQAVEKALAQGFRQGEGHIIADMSDCGLQFANGNYNVELARNGGLTVYIVEKHKCESYGTLEGSEGHNDFVHWTESDCWCRKKKIEKHSSKSGEPLTCDTCGDYFSGVYLAELVGKTYGEVKEALKKVVGEEYIVSDDQYMIQVNPSNESMGWQYININVEFMPDYLTGENKAYRLTFSLPDGHPMTSDGLQYNSRATYREIESCAEQVGAEMYNDHYGADYGYPTTDVYLRTPSGLYLSYNTYNNGDNGEITDDTLLRSCSASSEYDGHTFPDISGICFEDLIGKPESALLELRDEYSFFTAYTVTSDTSPQYKSVEIKIGRFPFSASLGTDGGNELVVTNVFCGRASKRTETEPTVSEAVNDYTFTLGELKASGLKYVIDGARITLKTPSGVYLLYLSESGSELTNDSMNTHLSSLMLNYIDNNSLDFSDCTLSDFIGKDYSCIEEFANRDEYGFYSRIVDYTERSGAEPGETCYMLRINRVIFYFYLDESGTIRHIMYYSPSDLEDSDRPSLDPDFPYKSMTVADFRALMESGEYKYTVSENNGSALIDGEKTWTYIIDTSSTRISASFTNVKYDHNTDTYSLKTDEELAAETITFNTIYMLPFTMGDVNNDGKVTLVDAILTLKFATNVDLGDATFIKSAADVSGNDGSITREDAIAVLKIAMNASV